MRKILNLLLNIGLGSFLLYTIVLVVLYFSFLIGRITNPGQKNMSNMEAVQYGMLALAFLVIDYFVAKRLIRAMGKENR